MVDSFKLHKNTQVYSYLSYLRLVLVRVVCGKIFLFLLLFNSSSLFSFDFSIRPKVFISIPGGEGNLAPDGSEMYNTGGGGEIGFEIDLSTILPNPLGVGYTLGVEGGLTLNPLMDESGKNISLYSAGGAFGLYFFPLSRLLTRVDGSIGLYQAAFADVNGDIAISMPGRFLRYGGEVGFRFTPGFTLAANAGKKQYEEKNGRLLNSGTYAGITGQMTFQTGRKTSEGIGVSLEQYGAVYPGFMQLYQKSPIGNIVIRNNENAEIRDVRISFRAGSYTSSEYQCASFLILPRGRKVNVPLLADFSSEILRFTDNGRIIGEIVIRYKYLGQQRETVRAVTVAVHNRNKITESDVAALAAFISPTSSETLEFARNIAGLERVNRRTGHNNNLTYAVWLFEGLKTSGIQLRNINDESSDDSVQFPAETMLFRSGTARDLAVLFAACLEGVGIGSAFIQTENELLAVVSLGVNTSQAETLFNGTSKILIVNDKAYLPLSMTALNEGFLAAWNRAASILNSVFTTGGLADFAATEDAWAVYPPAIMYELGRTNLRIDNAAVLREFNRFMQTYITQEINPVIQRTANMPNSATQQNRLGILYVRAGRIPEGKAAYERAAGMGSVPAMTNRGNLALIERDFTTAERWFRQALQREPQNRAALRGLERVATGR